MQSPSGSSARTVPFGLQNLRAWATSLVDFARSILLAVIFFLILTPVAVVLRLLGHRGLSLAIDRKRTSYWRKRDATRQGTLRNQY